MNNQYIICICCQDVKPKDSEIPIRDNEAAAEFNKDLLYRSYLEEDVYICMISFWVELHSDTIEFILQF